MAAADHGATVTASIEGRVGRILLCRPRALNALDLAMIEAITAALLAWRDENSVHAVVIDSASPMAFCAGGDIRAVRALALAGDAAGVHTYFAAEYGMNGLVATYGKPVVSLVNGICMGGGIGLCVHGAVRVATERAVFAMPETAIGFFPDVGTSHVLPRLPGALGAYLGLTGARLTGACAVHAGLATHFVASARLPDLVAALATDGVAVVAAFAEKLPPYSLAGSRAEIDHCFGAADIDTILSRVATAQGAWADDARDRLAAASPSAVRWTHALLQAGATRSLADCLAAELALTAQVTAHPDFAEGIRALLVDKDRTPHWRP